MNLNAVISLVFWISVWYITWTFCVKPYLPERPVVQELYSRKGKVKPNNPKPSRRYWVHYDLIYEGGGSSEFDGYYYTYIGARIMAFIHAKINSYGGDVVLTDRHKEKANEREIASTNEVLVSPRSFRANRHSTEHRGVR